MRFQTLLVVVVGLLLGLVALEGLGEAAAGRAPTWLTAPDTTPPEKVLWEGAVIPREGKADHVMIQLGGPVIFVPEMFPVVSIGQPEIWRLPDLYPPQKMPLLMQAQLQVADFYLVRLFCSFRPVLGRSRVGWARFHVVLLPDSQGRQPLAYDISPVYITQEVKRQLKFTLAPTLKFRTVVEAEVGSLEFGLEYPELQPVIVGAGVGEAMPTWDYQTATGVAGIQGAKWMHLLVKAPKGMPAATAQLALRAQVYVESISSWMPIVGGPIEQGGRLDAPLWPAPRSL